jgi:hypothetical protein
VAAGGRGFDKHVGAGRSRVFEHSHVQGRGH